MSVRQNKLGRWVVDFYPDGRSGKQVRITLAETITTRTEALRVEADLKKRNKDKIPTGKTLNDFYPAFESYLKLHRSEETHKCMVGVYDRELKPFFGRMPVEHITTQVVEAYQKKRLRQKTPKGTTVSKKTVNNEIFYLRSFFRWAKEKRLGFKCPEIEMLGYNRPLPKILGEVDVNAILNACEPFYRLYFSCLYILGMRKMEASTLTWDNVNWSDKTVYIKQGKWGKPRFVPMMGSLYDNFRERWEKEGKPVKGWVFPSPHKPEQPFKYPRKALQNACDAAKVSQHIYPHLLRHTGGTHLLKKCGNLRVVQDLLGHGSINVTELYTHIDKDDVRENVSKLLR